MTINIFVLKGDLNGKIVVVRFFFLLGIVHLLPRASSNLRDVFLWFIHAIKDIVIVPYSCCP